MNWDTATGTEIVFVSPEGNTFQALWRGNDRSIEKKLGTFDAPKVRGTYVQDMDTKSVPYPLTVYFDGPTHHKTSDDFFKSLQRERGKWDIAHPTKGLLQLQLVSAKEVIAPVENGNFTIFEMEWLEPAALDRIVSAAELGALSLLAVLDAIDNGITQAQQLKSDLYAAVNAAANLINKVAGIINSAMAQLAALENVTMDAWETAKSELESALEKLISDPTDTDNLTALCQAMADIVTIPVDASSDYSTRFSEYSDLADSIFVEAPSGNSVYDYNRVVFLEMYVISILGAICRIIVTSDFVTRKEIVSAMDNLTTVFDNCINTLESVQKEFEDLDIDVQYFSQSSSWTSVQQMFSLTMQYLTAQFFNLKTERRFAIKRDRSPLEITVTEYGELGEDDSNYDLFISSNNLTGSEILLLPAGKEVVIYA